MTLIEARKYKQGQWRGRTRYAAYVDGECIGVDYKTPKEAKQAATNHVDRAEELMRGLDEQLRNEFGLFDI